MDVRVLCVVCSQVEVSGTGRSHVQRSPTECGVSVCDLETSTRRRLGPVGFSNHGGGNEGTYKYEAKVSATRPSIVITNSIELCIVPFLRCSQYSPQLSDRLVPLV